MIHADSCHSVNNSVLLSESLHIWLPSAVKKLHKIVCMLLWLSRMLTMIPYNWKTMTHTKLQAQKSCENITWYGKWYVKQDGWTNGRTAKWNAIQNHPNFLKTHLKFVTIRKSECTIALFFVHVERPMELASIWPWVNSISMSTVLIKVAHVHLYAAQKTQFVYIWCVTT